MAPRDIGLENCLKLVEKNGKMSVYFLTKYNHL